MRQQRGVRFIQEQSLKSSDVYEKTSDNKPSRLRLGGRWASDHAPLPLAGCSRLGRLARLFRHPARTAVAGASCRDGQRGVFQRRESKFRRARRPFQSLDFPAAPGDWSPERVPPSLH